MSNKKGQLSNTFGVSIKNKSEYDRGVNTFSPEGRLFQIEYALGAVKLGSTSIGIKTSEGVVLVSERRIPSKLIEPKADAEKLRKIDTHIGCAVSGVIADAGIIIEHARVECQHYFFVYNEKMPVESCVNVISELTTQFSGISRPFGIALLIAGINSEGKPSLWQADPAGRAIEYNATAIGAAQEGAESLLQDQYKSTLTLQEAEVVALNILRQVMEEKLTSKNVVMAAVKADTQKFHFYTQDDIELVIKRFPDDSNVVVS